MEYQSYANRIKSLTNFYTFEKPINEYEEVARFVVKQQ